MRPVRAGLPPPQRYLCVRDRVPGPTDPVLVRHRDGRLPKGGWVR